MTSPLSRMESMTSASPVEDGPLELPPPGCTAVVTDLPLLMSPPADRSLRALLAVLRCVIVRGVLVPIVRTVIAAISRGPDPRPAIVRLFLGERRVVILGDLPVVDGAAPAFDLVGSQNGLSHEVTPEVLELQPCAPALRPPQVSGV